MIAEPPSALAMFVRRLMENRAGKRREREQQAGCGGVVDGGSLNEVPARSVLALAAASGASALAAVHVPGPLREVDILALPDRDHQRSVVPDYDHIEFE